MKPTTIKKLDDVFSDFIRLRDADDKGYITCPLCGTVVFWKYADNAHYIDRGNMATRYHEKNCNTNDKGCNQFKDGNKEVYKRWLIGKYGDDVIVELDFLKHQTLKISETEGQLLIKHYREKVKELKELKGL